MQTETLKVERPADGVALVTIDRPEKRNAMNWAFFRELPALLDDFDDDPDVRACVLTGAGVAFSAGGDIENFDQLDGIAAYRRQDRLVLRAFNRLEQAETPVIAAVNGLAFGGGTEIALASDIVVASDRATFAFREVTLGLMPGFGVLRGPDVIGRPWTRWMALTGEAIDAAHAERIGLVQEVVPHDRLLARSVALARRIADQPPIAVRAAKQFINRGTGPIGLPEAIEATALLHATPDHRARVDAFLAGRRPAEEQRDLR